VAVNEADLVNTGVESIGDLTWERVDWLNPAFSMTDRNNLAYVHPSLPFDATVSWCMVRLLMDRNHSAALMSDLSPVLATCRFASTV
jgi:hypothetical protein